ncbi:MAG: efflux RND transporter periplasmic adaptor subunit [Rhodothermaceae bacterium]
MKFKNIIYIAVVTGSLFLIGFILISNKKAIEREAELSNQVTDEFPVETEIVKMKEFTPLFKSTGYLVPGKELIVTAGTQGKIVDKKINAGDYVSKNSVLVKVDDDMFKADFITAEAAFQKAKLDEERFKTLYKANAVSKRNYEEAKLNLKNAEAKYISTQKRYNDSKIKAPFTGYINSVFIEEGQTLGSGTQVCELIDNRKLKIFVKLSAKEIDEIENVESVSVFPESKLVEMVPGKIKAVSEKADASQKFVIEIEIDNPSRKIKAGCYADVSFNFEPINGIIINKNSLLGSTRDAEVFINRNGKSVKRKIVTGKSFDDYIEVLEGLLPDEEVVVSGQINIKQNSGIKVIKKN